MNYRRNFQVGKDTDAPLPPCPYSTEADVTTSGVQRVKQMEGSQGNQRGHHGQMTEVVEKGGQTHPAGSSLCQAFS
jgi:hypothetical protein